MTSPNGTPYFRPSTFAQGLANYPHARLVPSSSSSSPTPGPKTLFISGTSSRRGDGTYAGCTTDPTTGEHKLDVRAQTAAVLENIGAIIQGASNGTAGLEAVADATVFLTDIRGDYAGMNEEWNRVWPDREKAPARTCVQVAALPNERLNVEIKCTAIIWEGVAPEKS
ncbi:putative L-PSP family endoribonuclease [Pseudomassariella vexata]|uniref:Putative L-PSP family endoribonuclease n=1 Tax=Pseudomassariella vexata TaxID=1141098 RepID=A0A1Y2EB13_9PEZI|nr:putative L-PSP family endoribonuclease [Pseudomassariella vexata]ORY68760.1 putative L-PSP family endoribonuclease [Pseudomassariella vexata]